jgi:hypothetical protein
MGAGSKMLGSQPERFVVIASKSADRSKTKAWETGVRHVVFEQDSANMAHLAVMSAELRLKKGRPPEERSFRFSSGLSGLL